MTQLDKAALALPEIPDDDADFTPELARKIIAKYQAILGMRNSDLAEALRSADGMQARLDEALKQLGIVSAQLGAARHSVDGMREAVEFPKAIFTHPSATAEGDKTVPIISNVRADGMREALEWHPIETAPKTGEAICYINQYGEIGHCRWCDDPKDQIWWDDVLDDEARPLAWMKELPPAPSVIAP